MQQLIHDLLSCLGHKQGYYMLFLHPRFYARVILLKDQNIILMGKK